MARGLEYAQSPGAGQCLRVSNSLGSRVAAPVPDPISIRGLNELYVIIALHDIESGLIAVQPGCFGGKSGDADSRPCAREPPSIDGAGRPVGPPACLSVHLR